MASFNLVPKYVTLANGARLYTERVTSKNATTTAPPTTVVFTHGLGGSTNMFYPIFSHILTAFPSYTLLAYDFAGVSNSPRPSSLAEMTWATAGKNLELLLDQEVPLGNIIIVAHSASTFLTSQLLLSFAASIPRVTHAVLIGGPMGTPIPQTQVDFLLQTADRIETEGATAVIDSVLAIWTGQTAVEKASNAAALTRALFTSQSPQQLVALFRDFVRTVATTRLPLEKFPQHLKVVVLYGLEDLVISLDVMEGVVARIPGAKLATLPAVGHTPQVEEPEASAKIIADFLKQ